MAATLAKGERDRLIREAVAPLVAQVREALAILERGTGYERLHVPPVLQNGLDSLEAALGGAGRAE